MPRQRQILPAFLRKAKSLLAVLTSLGQSASRQAEEQAELGKKIEAINLENVLTPVWLTSKAHIQDSRARIKNYLALKQEGERISQNAVQSDEKLILQVI